MVLRVAGGGSVLEWARGLRRTHRLLYSILGREPDPVSCHAATARMWHQALLDLEFQVRLKGIL